MFVFATNLAGQRVVGNGKLITETRPIQNYKAIFVQGSFDVVLTDNLQKEVSIQGEENIIPLVVCEVVNDELLLKWKPKVSISTKKGVKVFVPFQQIEKVKLKGSGDIWSDNKTIVENFVIDLEGSGDIDLNINAQKLQVNLMGSGDVDLKGEVQEAFFSLQGSGDISAFDLICQTAEVSVFGSGDVEVTAKKSFIGKVFGSGDISVKGNPKKIHRKIFGSGDIDFE